MSSSFSVQCTSSGFSMTRKTCPRDIVYKKAIRSRTVLKMADNFKKIMGGEFELVLPVDDSLVTRVNLLRKTISQTYIHCEDDEEAIPLAKVQSALSFLCPITLISKSEIVVALLSLGCLLGGADTIYAKVSLRTDCCSVLNDIVSDDFWVRPARKINKLSHRGVKMVSNQGEGPRKMATHFLEDQSLDRSFDRDMTYDCRAGALSSSEVVSMDLTKYNEPGTDDNSTYPLGFAGSPAPPPSMQDEHVRSFDVFF